MENQISLPRTVPSRLYRYYKWDRGIELLTTKKLQLSTVSFYNDPFEFLPASKYTDELRKLTYDQLLQFIADKCQSIGEQFADTLKKMDPEEKNLPLYQKVFQNSRIAQMVGIASFAKFSSGIGTASLLASGSASAAAASAAVAVLPTFGAILTVAASLAAISKYLDSKKMKNLQEVLDVLEAENKDVLQLQFFIESCYKFLNHIKTCCFSAKYDDILLWSHYAEHHRGLSISFKTAITYWMGLDFKAINYIDKRIPIPLNEDNSTEFITNLITSKAKCWEYEQEWRLIKYDAYNINSIQIDPAVIDCIYLGLKISEDQCDTIKKIRDQSYKNAKIKRAYMKNNTFELDFKTI